jgi:hypothetical protein
MSIAIKLTINTMRPIGATFLAWKRQDAQGLQEEKITIPSHIKQPELEVVLEAAEETEAL